MALKSLLACVALAFSVGPVQLIAQSAQDPDHPTDVIDSFLEALGGEMTLVSVETLSAKVTFEGWTNGSAQFHFKEGKRLDLTTISGTTGYDSLHDGEQWCTRWPAGFAKTDLSKSELHMQQAPFNLPTDALRLQRQAIAGEFEFIPKEEFEDGPYAHCVGIRLKDDEEMNIYRFFNPETGLLECIERWVGEIPEKRRMHIRYYQFEFREVDGLLFLKSSKRTIGSDQFLDLVYSDHQVDQPVDENLFRFEVDDD